MHMGVSCSDCAWVVITETGTLCFDGYGIVFFENKVKGSKDA